MKEHWLKNLLQFMTAIGVAANVACGDQQFSNVPVPPKPFFDPYTYENFTAPWPPPDSVDILFIVDNSGSMSPDQDNLAQKFPNFINELAGIDWRIGFTTTDTTGSGPDGLLVPLKDSFGNPLAQYVLTPGLFAQSYFENTVRQGMSGSGQERGLRASSHALQKKSSSIFNGFFRSQAGLAIIILTDEDENSDSYNRPPKTGGPVDQPWFADDEPQFLVDTFNSSFIDKSFTFNAIEIIPGDFNCRNEQLAQFSGQTQGTYGYVYTEAVELTGGIYGSICAASFTNTVTQIGKNIKQQLYSFTLQRIPQPGSLSITLSPEDPTAQWTLKGLKIFFDKPLSPNTKITVKYL